MRHRGLVRAILLLACTVSLLSVQTIARADVIGPEQFLNAVDRQVALDSVNRALARDEVRNTLKHYGVDPFDAAARVAALNDRELTSLAEDLDRLPAGSGALSTLGLAAIVVLILELIGVIDIFKEV